jgi:hypothetical protein
MRFRTNRWLLVTLVGYLFVHCVLLFLLYFSPVGWVAGSRNTPVLRGVLLMLRILDAPTRGLARATSAEFLVAYDGGGLPLAPLVNCLILAGVLGVTRHFFGRARHGPS